MCLRLKSYLVWESECFAMLKFRWLPGAQTAAAKRLTRFIWQEYYVLLYDEVFLKNNEPFWGKMSSNTSMLSGSCWWFMIVQVCSLISVFPATPDAQSAAAKRLTRFILKVIISAAKVISLWWDIRVSECFAMLKFRWLPGAQTAAAKRLTRFIWKEILCSTIWWSIFEK